MISTIPLLPLPYKAIKNILHGYYPIASTMLPIFPTLENDLEETGSELNAKEYVSGALFSFTFYFFAIGAITFIYGYRNLDLSQINIRLGILLTSLSIAISIFAYTMIFPRWVSSKRKVELERNLLFAVRHLMIQTTAGVPLFDSIVSIGEEYGSSQMDYGEIGREFRRIIKEVRGGKELAQGLDESAARNPSASYKRVMWQLSNANRAGANVGFVLKDVVELLSNEHRIAIRNYGSQLNPLSLFYMLTCVIAPTMGLIFLAIMSTLVSLPINGTTFLVILTILVVIQIMFIGLLKSRRPQVAL